VRMLRCSADASFGEALDKTEYKCAYTLEWFKSERQMGACTHTCANTLSQRHFRKHTFVQTLSQTHFRKHTFVHTLSLVYTHFLSCTQKYVSLFPCVSLPLSRSLGTCLHTCSNHYAARTASCNPAGVEPVHWKPAHVDMDSGTNQTCSLVQTRHAV